MLKLRLIREAFVIASLMTPRRIINYTRIRLSYMWSCLRKKAVHCGYPVFIAVEPNNTCNLHCPECPTGNDTMIREKGKINTELFKKLIDDISPFSLYLNLCFQGEPLMVSYLPLLISYARSRKMYVSTSTNAHFLSDEIAKQLLDSGLNRIVISMDGALQESYQKYRIGGDIEKVKAGISNLVKAKRNIGSISPLIVLQFIVFKHNQNEIEDIRAFGRQSGVDIVELKSAQIENPANILSMLPDDTYSRYTYYNNKLMIKSALPDYCYRMWSSAVVTWNMLILPCCFDKNAAFLMGDLNQMPFGEIWKSTAYKNFRAKIFSKRKGIEMCCNCTEGLKSSKSRV